MSYYLVTHQTNGGQFIGEMPSKTKLRRELPRFCEPAGEYCSFWDMEEISFAKYRKLDKDGVRSIFEIKPEDT